MVKFKKKIPLCKACNDTGKNSKGGSCYPCKITGRLTNESKKEALQKAISPQAPKKQVSKAPDEKVAASKKRVFKFKKK